MPAAPRPAVEIAAGTTFETFRVFELPFDSTERERKGLALRRMYRVLARGSPKTRS